jgi:CRP-like cAMP-binding protein
MTALEHFSAYVQHFVQPDKAQMQAFLSTLKVEDFVKNDILVQEGEVCSKVWFVHRGILRHYLAKGHTEGTVWFSFPSDLLTEAYSLIKQKPAVHNVIAVTDCQLLSISHAELQHFYDTEKIWERFGRLTTAHYLFLQMERCNDLLFKTGKEKYDAFLAAHPEALQYIPLHQIADFIGVKFETLSRIRGRRG